MCVCVCVFLPAAFRLFLVVTVVMEGKRSETPAMIKMGITIKDKSKVLDWDSSSLEVVST